MKEYLTLALVQPSSFDSILALTFTNKAAAEMKNRILESLHWFLAGNRDPIMDQVMAETHIPSDKAHENAQRLMDFILHRYSDFSVMTIDSFISRVVRAFSFELEMPLRYDVELDMESMTGDIIEILAASASETNFTGKVLVDFAVSKIRTMGSWNIDRGLRKLGDLIFMEKHLEPVQEIMLKAPDEGFWTSLLNSVEKRRDEIRMRLRSLAMEAYAEIRNRGLSAGDFLYKDKGAGAALEKLLGASDPQDMKLNKNLEEGRWYGKTTPPEVISRIDAALEAGLREKTAQLVGFVNKNREEYISYGLIAKTLYTEALVSQFIAAAEVYKREQSRIPLFDYSRKVWEVVRNEPVPFIYWRIGSRFHHVMIDELQDTSRLQWENLFPLIEESLADGHLNLGVGDGKQAIYRFRSGDVRIMVEMPLALGEKCESRALNRNYRSGSAIVTFNNHLFSALADKCRMGEEPLFQSLYSREAVCQEAASLRSGFVQIAEVKQETHHTKKDRKKNIMRRVVDEIRSVIREDAGYTCRDIAILVRSNEDAEIAANTLLEAGIPFISPDALKLKNASCVRFIIAALRYITGHDMTDLLNLWLLSGRSAETFEEGREGLGLSGIEETILPGFSRFTRRILGLPIYEAVEEIIHAFRLNEGNQGFIQSFLESVLSHSEKYGTDLYSFLEWWDAETESEKAALISDEQADSVLVSTIHKSKGLEFPIVMIPMGWDMTGISHANKEMIWVVSDRVAGTGGPFPFLVALEKNLEESWFREYYAQETELCLIDNINLLYVALTRASDRLYLYMPEKAGTPASHENRPIHGDAMEWVREHIQELGMQRAGECMTLGERTVKSAKTRPLSTELASLLPCFLWRKKITLKKRAEEMWKSSQPGRVERVDRGLLIHSILARIETPEDIPKAVEESQWEGMIRPDEGPALTQELQGIMKIQYRKGRVGDWFSKGLSARNEAGIAAEGSTYRPDRVILDGKRALVIDYKTGSPSPADLDQIRGYARLLEAMGYSPVEKYLLYLERGEVREG